jgi:hypothetical protein
MEKPVVGRKAMDLIRVPSAPAAARIHTYIPLETDPTANE